MKKVAALWCTVAFMASNGCLWLLGFTWCILLTIRWAHHEESPLAPGLVLLGVGLHSALVQWLMQQGFRSLGDGPEPSREGVEEPVRPVLRVIGDRR